MLIGGLFRHHDRATTALPQPKRLHAKKEGERTSIPRIAKNKKRLYVLLILTCTLFMYTGWL